MKTQTKIYIIFGLATLVLVLFAYVYNGNKEYKQEVINYKNFIKNSSKLVNLQNKWQDKKEDKKFIKQIKSKFKPTSYEEKGSLYILDFDSLSKTNLNRLGKMLLNSDLNIRTIDLKKENEKASLHVEVQI